MRRWIFVALLFFCGSVAHAQVASPQAAAASGSGEQENLKEMMQRLWRNPGQRNADSLIRYIALRDPDMVYTYAASGSALSRKIRSSSDPLVKTIGKMATMKSGRMYFPFLDQLYRGNETFESIAPALKDDRKYYSLLVKTRLSYAERLSKGDIPIGHTDLTARLKQKAVETYIIDINGLHNSPDAVRFRKIQSLSPEELYYLAVMGAEEIYTSSYLGVYKRIFEKLKTADAGEQLLNAVHHDQFKKWIRLAAGYNTLDDFLAKMDKGSATTLMQSFVAGLENTASLEDAVDVADAYASISDEQLQQLIMREVQKNQAEAVSPRAKQIYSLLNTIFLSKDPANNIDVTAVLGINPIFKMPYSSLSDNDGRVIIEQFIYGDEIGPGDFAEFLSTFRNSNWKIVNKPQWVEIESVKGKPVTIYANKPLDERKGLDAKAQSDLNEYLYKNKLYPTIAIHRGHSYHVRSTIDQLPSSARVVLLGSCGGYNNLSDVLSACPQAHIIATKQTGTALITQPLINLIADMLREGKDLEWPAMWAALDAKFRDKNSKEKFEDYVPPHKNLGAIFMTAYQKLEGGRGRVVVK